MGPDSHREQHSYTFWSVSVKRTVYFLRLTQALLDFSIWRIFVLYKIFCINYFILFPPPPICTEIFFESGKFKGLDRQTHNTFEG